MISDVRRVLAPGVLLVLLLGCLGAGCPPGGDGGGGGGDDDDDDAANLDCSEVGADLTGYWISPEGTQPGADTYEQIAFDDAPDSSGPGTGQFFFTIPAGSNVWTWHWWFAASGACERIEFADYGAGWEHEYLLIRELTSEKLTLETSDGSTTRYDRL